MAGNYTLTVTNGSDCSGNATTTVVVNPKPVASASSTPVCEGGTIELTGGPGNMTTYSWTGPGNFTSDQQSPSIPNATLAMAGNYTLIVTNGSDCSGNATTTVVVNPKPVASASSTPVCEGGTIELTGGPGNMTTYSWTGPGNFTSSSNPRACLMLR